MSGPTPHARRPARGILLPWAATLVVAASGCAGEPDPEDLLQLPPLRLSAAAAPGPAPVVAPPTPTQVAEGSYQLPGREARITLRDGVWEDRSTGAFAQLSTGLLVLGDFDGDGADETAAVLSVGGRGVRVAVFLLGLGTGSAGVTQEATLLLGAGVQVRGMRAVDGAVELRMLAFSPGDDPCCPSRQTLRRLRIRNGSWTDR